MASKETIITKPKPSTLKKTLPRKSVSTALPKDFDLELKKAPPRETVPDAPAEMALISVTNGKIGGVDCPVVDGLSLHKALGSKRHFATWIKARIDDYDFIEDRDYSNLGHPESRNQDSNAHGGDRKSIKYNLTLTMARELAMVERTDAGRAVRRYFIECEERLIAASGPTPIHAGSQTLPYPEIIAHPGKVCEFKDWNGRSYEKNGVLRHQALVVQLVEAVGRKAAYEQYAQTREATGPEKKQLAEEVAECVQRKLAFKAYLVLKKHPELTGDLNALKAKIEMEINN